MAVKVAREEPYSGLIRQLQKMSSTGKINVNVGVLGHVDSGKTSLCKALSTTASTAAFDSNPQSKERGITLDLGFSSLSLESKEHDKYNITLVDCPGHSSLIRTVIGGAQIMDIMLLIIDINKGMQPQAGECLILAHITSQHLIVVLNKVDLIAPDQREVKISKATKLMQSVLSKTKFGNEPIVPVSAADPSIGTEALKQALARKIDALELVRDTTKPFLMAVDHCFSIKGQGTIATGTVLQGSVKVNDMVDFPTLLESKKVKSIQSFRVPVNEAFAGDRVGIAFPGLDSSNIERTVIASPGVVTPAVRAAILGVEKIQFFKKPIVSKKKYHISVGYETVTARVTLFEAPTDAKQFTFDDVYEFLESVDIDTKGQNGVKKTKTAFALLEFDKPVMTTPYSLVIGSDLQSEDENTCRLAFFGQILSFTQDKQYATSWLPNLKVFKLKQKTGQLDRIVSESQFIAKGFCKKESNIDHLIGLKVTVVLPLIDDNLAVNARIESRFGQTDKVRLGVLDMLTTEDSAKLKDNLKKAEIRLHFKKYLFSPSKSKLVQ